MKKIAAAGMAFFLVGMSAGSGWMWSNVPASAAAREDVQTAAEMDGQDITENITEEDGDMPEKGGRESPDAAEFPDGAAVSNPTEAPGMDIIPNGTALSDREESPGEAGASDKEVISDTEESLTEAESSGETFQTDADTDLFSDGEQKAEVRADLSMAVRTEADTVKAGSDLVYTVIAENTGDCDLKDIRFSYRFSDAGFAGEWSEGAEDAVGNIAYIEKLEASETKILYLTVHIPEDRTDAISLKLSATATKAVGEDESGETEEIVQNAELVTKIQALQASFEVTKTADRSMAVPGDEIRFLICIRNTGERTLHSVVTTERFQLGNVPVRFVEKEGVTLNKAGTKAKIAQILPGEAFGLEAIVTLPQDLKDQNLINEVSVTTLETGEQAKTARSEIEVKAEEKEEETDPDNEEETVNTQEESRPASTHPKTGDPYQPLLWLSMIPGSLLAAGWLRSRM